MSSTTSATTESSDPSPHSSCRTLASESNANNVNNSNASRQTRIETLVDDDDGDDIDVAAAAASVAWETFHNWVHCICVVTFDLELGQALESVYPGHVRLTRQDTSNICYLAFPDSNSSCMGDTAFAIRLQTGAGRPLNSAQRDYNALCPIALQVHDTFMWGFVYFRQVKDIGLPRGYFQKSVVILSHLPFCNLFGNIVSLIAPEYFDNGLVSLETACAQINSWPLPAPGVHLALPLLGTIYQTYIPKQSNATTISVQWAAGVSSPEKITSIDELPLFEVLQPVLSQIDMLWELVITAEPLIIMSSSPTSCSRMVIALTRLMAPHKFYGDHRPYFTIHDTDFKQFTSKIHGLPPVILGVTNPFFAKTLHHWPHIIRLGESFGNYQKYKVKRNSNVKMLDCSPGVYTTYKPFLQKDKALIKNILNGIRSHRPIEVQSAILQRHLLELTQSFMIPLERYIGSLLPLLKNISPFKDAPMPLPFNPDQFLSTLELAGPHLTSGVKGDWIGLYRRFFRSPNFNGWFNARYNELVLKLQALQLQALSTADLKLWVRGKPEVEVIDMVLRLKAKILKCQSDEVPVTVITKQQLMQRFDDIVRSLPEDTKFLFKDT